MTPKLPTCLLACVLLGPVVTPVPGQAPSKRGVTPDEVRQAIDNGILYLKGRQNRDGAWGDYLNNRGARTSLCTLALLNAGVKPDDPDMKRALKNLRKVNPTTTYAVALQTMALCQAGFLDRDLTTIKRNVGLLMRFESENQSRGVWNYGTRGGRGDNSNSQFALLALHEARRVGVDVNEALLRRAKRYWEDCQNPDGSWGYQKGNSGTGSMTCAGIAAMVITSDMVNDSDARVDPVTGRINCCRRADSDDDRVRRGLAWLGRHFSVDRNPGSRYWVLYYLYGVERVGRLTARRFIGKHDWYREGAEKLVREQQAVAKGFWTGVGRTAENDPEIATALALLFLSKGRRPILLSKLRHGGGDDWNWHRGDVAKLTRYVEPRWKLDLTWQAIDVDAATADDLVQSPVLFYCGAKDPLPATDEARRKLARKLRDYLDRGGFLFAEAQCGGIGFDTGFRRLMELVFPEPEYQLRLLPPEHPIWRAEEEVAPELLAQHPIEGVEFGCRTSVVYFPPFPKADPGPSLSCLWELSRSGRGQKLGAKVQAQVDAAFSIGINVLAYATNRELKTKDQNFRTTVDRRSGDKIDRGKLAIASLRHPGGCSAAPRALVNLLETAGKQLKMRVGLRPRELNITDDALFDYHLVFMHGRSSFRLTNAERERLREFVERGGMILADAICASRPFTDSFRHEMATIFPKNALERIPLTDALLTTAYGGSDLKTVSRRDPLVRRTPGPLKATLRKVPPQLEGIKLDDRWGVVFSPYDLSCALEKHDSLECRGYTRDDAARIGLNVILYSLHE